MSTLGSLFGMGSYYRHQNIFYTFFHCAPCAKCFKIDISLNWAYDINIGGTTAKQNSFDIMRAIHQ